MQAFPAISFVTTAVVPLLERATGLALATLSSVMCCLLALAVSLLLVCEGLRAADEMIGSRVALVGVAGAMAAFLFRYVARGQGGPVAKERDSPPLASAWC